MLALLADGEADSRGTEAGGLDRGSGTAAAVAQRASEDRRNGIADAPNGRAVSAALR